MAFAATPPSDSPRSLVAVLSNPPLTSGDRTMARLEIARSVLRFDSLVVTNLFGRPTRSSGDISTVGTSLDDWLDARDSIENALDSGNAVLFAFGKAEPSGVARAHRREQVSWLTGQVAARSLPIWQLGEYAHHPSRWQRWTYRNAPELGMKEALRFGLRIVE